MKLSGRLIHYGVAAVTGLGLLALAAGSAGAQVGRDRVGPDGEPIKQFSLPSRVSGAKDQAYSDLRSVGRFGSRACWSNLYAGMCYQQAFVPFNYGIVPAGFPTTWFDAGFIWGVPKTTWDSARAKVSALSNALGGGWTVSTYDQSGADDMDAADGSLGLHHKGTASTSDRSCRDHTVSIGAGNPLLPGIDCPDTWGTEGWKGARPIPLDVYLARFNANQNRKDLFDFWTVPDLDLDAAGVAATKTIGAFQTYGFTSDFTAEILCGTATKRNYGHLFPATTLSQVVPGGCTASDPTRKRPGWPLGIEVRFDAFTFQLPALQELAYFQVTFTNRSRKVYGVPLDYDSLYVSFNNGWLNNSQRTIASWAPELGVLTAHAGPRAPCVAAREVVDLTCTAWGGVGATPGFSEGATAVIVLKSPIGDLRNKLLTRTLAGAPCSPAPTNFCNPSSPIKGDTITFNHAHMCGFRACARNITNVDPVANPDAEQRMFGLISSTETNVFGSRTPSGMGGTPAGQVYWHTFRNAGFPTVCPSATNITAGCGFNTYAPSSWTPSTVSNVLHIEGCYVNGCSAMWGDTMPNGKYATYGNRSGQLGAGPFTLKADSTAAYVFALAPAADSASVMAEIAAAIDNYMNFYLAPDAAPKCRIAGVSRTLKSPTAAQSIALNWDNSCFAGQWTDPFLAKQRVDMRSAAAGTPLETIRRLNPWLAGTGTTGADTLGFLAANNLQSLYIFKSCNDGGSWTTANDCTTGSPATGGTFAGLGFLPYASFNTDDPTGIPNTFTDRDLLPGLTYTYSLVGQTRGANLQIINGDAYGLNAGGDTICTLNCRTETLALAPSLLNALSASTGLPSVARVYLAASLQAGASLSKAVVADSTGPMTSARIGVTVTNDSLTPANYRVLFGDSARATQVEKRYKTTLLSVTTRLVLRVPTSLGDSIVVTGTNLGGLTPGGADTTVTVVPGGTPDTTYTTRTRGWATGPVMALTRRTTTNVDPLLVSNTLTGDAATPGAFHTNADYPKFDLSVDRALANVFNRAFFLTDTVRRDTVGPLVAPTVTWISGSSVPDQVTGSNQANGDYQITFGAKPYGDGEPYRLDFTNPARSDTAIYNALVARTAVTRGVATDSAAAAIAASIGNPSFIKDSLVAVKLPFTVTNLSYKRPVLVAMRKRPGKTVLVGFGADTIRVRVPDDAWVPGDALFFIERIGTAPANPQRVTFRPAVVDCAARCNPVYPGTRGSPIGTSYLGETPGQALLASYHTPITAASQFTLAATAPVRGAALTSATAIKAGLANVRVVPNPYVMLSQFAGNVLMFTHMPPRGVLRIYTVAGQFVQQISWTAADLNGDGDLTWDMRSREGNEVAGGLFVYVLTAQDASGNTAGTRTGKFVIIR